MRKLVLFFLIVNVTIAGNAQSNTTPVTGILGAFRDEANYLLALVQQKKEIVIQQVHFTEGILSGRHVVIAQTGMGKVNAAITATLMLEHFQPREIIFTGIAGALNPQLLPGDLVIGTRVTYHDYGIIDPDTMLHRPTHNPFTLKENPLYFTCDTQLVGYARALSNTISLEKIRRNNSDQSPRIITGTIVTGDVFVSSETAARNLQQQLQADATEMEGAAVAQVCWQQQVPFILIRSMSDNANNHAHTDVQAFYEVAAHNSARFVMGILQMLAKK